jgi:hypothetical protein
MATGDLTHTAGALSRLRQRWFAPARPLAVDDEPRWVPGADPGEPSGMDRDGDLRGTPATKS